MQAARPPVLMSDELLVDYQSTGSIPLVEQKGAGKEGKEKKEKVFKGGIPVEVAYQIFRVANIDAVGQKFFADFQLFFQWCDPKLVGADSSSVNFEDGSTFHPRFYIKNAAGLDELDNTIKLKDPDTGRVVQHVHYRGELFQFFRLKNFPFDTQNLRIEISSKNHAGKNEFTKHTSRKSAVSSFHTMEWTMVGHKAKFVRTDPEDATSGNIISECQIKLKVSRMSSFYVWNVMFFTFLLTSLSFFVNGLETSGLNDRMGLLLTLILTTVAFKFAVGDSLPKISYFTILDYYLAFSSWFIFLMCLESFIVARINKWKGDEEYDAENLDSYLTYGWLIFWIIFNCLYVIFTGVSILIQRHEEKEGKDFIYL